MVSSKRKSNTTVRDSAEKQSDRQRRKSQKTATQQSERQPNGKHSIRDADKQSHGSQGNAITAVKKIKA